MRFELDALATAVGGRVTDRRANRSGPIAHLDHITIDSRSAGHQSLFVPIVADRDGHGFISDAVDRGAPAYLSATGPVDGCEAVSIEVDDTLIALGDIGRAARARIEGVVIGITGSVGKTTVKDLATGALSALHTVAASPASYNNELGVPLTLANAPDAPDAIVIEMGARGIGHIAELCGIARPNVGIVTAVAGAHLELFRTLDEVARAKSELVAALPADGLAVLNGDNPYTRAMTDITDAETVMFGLDAGLDVGADQIEVDDELRPRFTLRSPWGSGRVGLQVRGAHQVPNALSAAIPALWHGLDFEGVAAGLESVTPPHGRMDVLRAPSGAVIIDDAYNANPTSMGAALRSLAQVPARRRIAVLGVMAELGDAESDGHRQMAELARDLDIELVAVGTDLYGRRAVPVESVAASIGDLDDSTAILVKASRVGGLERVVAALRQADVAGDDPHE